TYRNVSATGAAVVNLTDDVRVFARAAIANPAYPTVPATVVPGVVLADCCSWRGLEGRSNDRTPPRSRIQTSAVPPAPPPPPARGFVGCNGACHAGVGTGIYATRLHILAREFVESELTRLQTIVDKTAGPREFEAMAILAEFIRSAPRERTGP